MANGYTTLKDKEKYIKALIEEASEIELALVWVPRIIENQTTDEVAGESTQEDNKIGLNAFDAEFVTSVYKQIKDGRTPTEKQSAVLHRTLKKYCRQYSDKMNWNVIKVPWVV